MPPGPIHRNMKLLLTRFMHVRGVGRQCMAFHSHAAQSAGHATCLCTVVMPYESSSCGCPLVLLLHKLLQTQPRFTEPNAQWKLYPEKLVDEARKRALARCVAVCMFSLQPCKPGCTHA